MQPPDHKAAEEIDDLGRILSVLFGEKWDRTPAELVRKYAPNRRVLSSSVGRAKQILAAEAKNLYLRTGSQIRVGGGGIVFQCVRILERPEAEAARIEYALKVTRPSLFKGDKKLADSLLELSQTRAEYVKHAPLSHQNIARVFDTAFPQIPLKGTNTPFSCPAVLMEWIIDPAPFSNWILERARNWHDVVNVTAQCFDGLHELHRRNLVHWDMKSDNVLVDASGTAKITDLGNSRQLDRNPSSTAQSTVWNIPPALKDKIKLEPDGSYGSSKRVTIELGAETIWDSRWLDMWMFARELNRLLLADPSLLDKRNLHPRDPYDPTAAAVFLAKCFPPEDDDSRFALEALRLVVRRLLRPKNPSEDPFYTSAGLVAEDLRKLLSEFGAAQAIEELRAVPQHVVRLPHSRNATYTARVAAFFNSPLMRRPSRHLQLSTLAHVYPGATHKRSEHILGVMASVIQFVRALYADRTNPFWRLAIEQRDIEALIVAALLHDAGHIAFGHYLEEMPRVFSGREHEDFVLELLTPGESRNSFSESARKGIRKDRTCLIDVLTKSWYIAHEEVESFLGTIATILRNPDPANPPVATTPESQLFRDSALQLKTEILHSIISSAIDADKLDYLLRDAHHCGVDYGKGIDLDRFLQSLTAIPFLPLTADRDPAAADLERTGPPTACIGVTEKGVLPVESILLARYQMFASVYWQHTARAETAMLQFLLQKYLATATSDSDAEHLLEQVIEKFREMDDVDALAWLTKRVCSRTPKTRNKQGNLLEEISRALLGERDYVYWHAFEMQYQGKSALGEFSRSGAKSLYERLSFVFEGDSKSDSLVSILQHARDLRTDFASRLARKLKLKERFIDGEVLVDVPPRGKDQISNIYVWSDVGATTIQQASPIADAVSDAFRYWVRRIRVFLAPSAWKKCLRHSSVVEVKTACHSVMTDIETAKNEPLWGWQTTSVRRKKRRSRAHNTGQPSNNNRLPAFG